MSSIAQKYYCLKTSIGGNREKQGFELTHFVPVENKEHITGPSRAQVRILSELEFVMHLSEENDGIYEGILEDALDYLLDYMAKEGALTNQACDNAEEMLMPAGDAAKEYKLILAAHAHIDMNWMWGCDETIAITLATFRSILNIMDQYPEFCFSQSQASVYKIVEELDPEMMEEIKERIAEGRWEVTASSWVETDKNMPSGESLIRHIEYTKQYLKEVWGVKRMDVDFSPDTFGHSANVPEINCYGDVKYYYHCRGKRLQNALYRYRALSGKEVLVYQEPIWYNSGITPAIGTNIFEVSKITGGMKTSLIVYGVGDHGGGPTRKDVERALEMKTWKIFPTIKFGSIHEFFDEAMKMWDKLPVRTEEINFIFPGCYTTQSRIKRGNKRCEAVLYDTECITALAGKLTGFPYEKEQLTSAWKNVLFNHFHDIITGSCTVDAREYSMALYQNTMSVAQTQIQNAMRKIALNIDTSNIPVDIDAYNSRSEGAGVGFGVENFIGVPSTERGSGKTRIFHIFNTLCETRKGTVELFVWDWMGDPKRMQLKDVNGNEIPFQILDLQTAEYYRHEKIQLLAEVTVPAMGYTTVVLAEKESEKYPVYLFEGEVVRIGVTYEDYILENEQIRARIDSRSGRIISMVDKVTGAELIAEEIGAGFIYVETEVEHMSAWNIGRALQKMPLERCVKLLVTANGSLRSSVKAEYQLDSSKVEVVYSLDKGASALKMDVKIDWNIHGNGKDITPVLNYRIPLAYKADEYMYDIPAGTIRRKDIHNDVPALSYGMALNASCDSNAILISDSKYGYYGADNCLGLTLINAATFPDPYPEIGIQRFSMWLGCCKADEKKAEQLAMECNHKLLYHPSNCHTGFLSMESSLFTADSNHIIVSAVIPETDGSLLVRVYETSGKDGYIKLAFANRIVKADAVKLSGEVIPKKAVVEKKVVTLAVEANSVAAVRVYF